MKTSNTPISKALFSIITAATACLCAYTSSADVTVRVDSTLQWLGFMNVWQTNGTSYVFGQTWGIPALRAGFVPTNSPTGWPLNAAAVLQPNINTYTNDAFWDTNGIPNKVLEANFYRDVGTNFANQTVTFTGTVLSNNIPGVVNGHPASGWEVLAVVKELTTTFGFVGMTSAPLTPGTFTVSRPIQAGHVCQYGFLVKGPNTPSNSVNALTAAAVLVEDADPAITNQPASITSPSGVTTNLHVAALGSGPLTYQWQTNGLNLVNGSKYSGVTTPTLTISGAQVSDSAAYTVIVSNTVTHTTITSSAAQLTVLDVVITASPQNQRVEQGSSATFGVTATSASSLTYQWRSVINGTTNFVVNGANVTGSSSNTLTLSNLQPTNSGFYYVTITASGKSVSVGANLLVKSYAEYANMLENSSFDNDTNGVNETPWTRFELTDPSWGHFQSASDTYFNGGNVNVLDGKYVSYTTYNGPYSGIFQDVAASPGQAFSADMYFYNASGDPIPGPSLNATNENYLEIQFRDVNSTVIRQYTTALSALTYATPQNVWFQLQATNAGGYGYNPPTSNAKYLVAPAGTTTVRFQLTMHDTAASGGNGSIYYDKARLMLKLPVNVTTSIQGGNIVLSWKSLGSTSYQVQYATSPNGPWLDLGSPVAGTGQTVTTSDALSNGSRVYRVLTL
jgi:hypothetical protein